MAKYVQPNFIVDSSSSFKRNVTFDSSVYLKGQVTIDGLGTPTAATPYALVTETNAAGDKIVKSKQLNTMAFEPSSNYYNSSEVDDFKIEIDASITRIDASLNDVIDIGEIIDASLATKVNKAGDTMTGQLVFDDSTGFQLDSVNITTIDTSANGLSELDTALPTSGLVKSYLASSDASIAAIASNLATTDASVVANTSNLVNTDASVAAIASDLVNTDASVAAIASDLVNTDASVAAIASNLATTDASVVANTSNLATTDASVVALAAYDAIQDASIASLTSGTITGGANGIVANGQLLELGGKLIKNTAIDGSLNNFSVNDTNTFSLSAADTGSKYSQLYGTKDGISLYHTVNGGDHQSINLGIDGFKVTDYINSRGLEYTADYSASYIDRSLPDWAAVKGYVDGSIASNEFVLSSGNGTTANGTAVDLGGPLTASTTITTDGNLFAVAGNFTINGDLTVDGSTTTVNSVNLDVSDNIITVNAGETGSGVSLGHAGLLIDRGQHDPYVFVFEEATTTFRVGIETEASLGGSTQAVATREDNPTAFGIGFWNGTESRVDTSSGFVYTEGVGAVYAEDTSSNYTDRTLVDKGYVDGQVSNALVTAASKYTGTFNGASDVSTVITGATHGLGSGPFNINVYESGVEIMPEISFNGSGDVKIEWVTGSLGASCSYIIVG